MTFKAVLFDMVGTTVHENDPMFISNCLMKAFGEHKIEANAELIQRHRGKEKANMIADILTELDYPQAMGASVLQRFRRNIEKDIENFSQADGARDIFASMMGRGIKVGIGSGLPRDVFHQVLKHLKWDSYRFDYLGTPDEVGRGRPHPDMILDMLKKLSMKPEDLLKVGDTVADIQEGRNAGVRTVAILSGTQPEKLLRRENPDFIIHRLAELKDIVK